MQEGTSYVGLDAHQESTNGAMILSSGEVVEDRFATTPDGIRRWVRRRHREAIVRKLLPDFRRRVAEA